LFDCAKADDVADRDNSGELWDGLQATALSRSWSPSTQHLGRSRLGSAWTPLQPAPTVVLAVVEVDRICTPWLRRYRATTSSATPENLGQRSLIVG